MIDGLRRVSLFGLVARYLLVALMQLSVPVTLWIAWAAVESANYSGAEDYAALFALLFTFGKAFVAVPLICIYVWLILADRRRRIVGWEEVLRFSVAVGVVSMIVDAVFCFLVADV